MYVNYNPNPLTARVGDCVIRAVSKALGQEWIKSYIDLCIYGITMCDLPSSNAVWGKYLHDKGFRRHIIPDTAGMYTVKMFSEDNPIGTYILALNGHVVTVQDGKYYDTWDSGNEIPIYYWTKEE